MFFQYNTELGPPYHVLIDTNFVNFAIKNKIDVVQGMMDCLYAKCECAGTPRIYGRLPFTTNILMTYHSSLMGSFSIHVYPEL